MDEKVNLMIYDLLILEYSKLLCNFWDWMHDELEHHCLCDSKHENFKEALDKFLKEKND